MSKIRAYLIQSNTNYERITKTKEGNQNRTQLVVSVSREAEITRNAQKTIKCNKRTKDLRKRKKEERKTEIELTCHKSEFLFSLH